LGLVLDPQFEETKYIYVYQTYETATAGEFKNRVLRLKEKNNRASVDRVLIDGLAGAQNHNGGRIKIGPDSYLYITVGDRYHPQLAQQESSLGGKILRIGLDGSIPEDNAVLHSSEETWAPSDKGRAVPT
jgi:glucose/arabinose dehydrogenase